ncbi:MAG TPA: STAS domain-containing protein [Tepidisphaeraceae bacterium]|jgi:anti-anti-sigma regulatory factor
MSASKTTTLKVAPTDRGCCVRIEGAGTMQESQAVRDLATRTLEISPDAVVVFDLSDCDYLDSTFIGCLLQLHQAYGKLAPPRYLVAAPEPRRKQLLGACAVDRILASIDTAPNPCGQWVALSATTVTGDRAEVMRHVMECHRALSQLDTPMKAAFARIADGIERDLANTPAAS